MKKDILGKSEFLIPEDLSMIHQPSEHIYKHFIKNAMHNDKIQFLNGFK